MCTTAQREQEQAYKRCRTSGQIQPEGGKGAFTTTLARAAVPGSLDRTPRTQANHRNPRSRLAVGPASRGGGLTTYEALAAASHGWMCPINLQLVVKIRGVAIGNGCFLNALHCSTRINKGEFTRGSPNTPHMMKNILFMPLL